MLLVTLVTGLIGCGGRARDAEQVDRDERIVIKFSHVVAENTPKGLAAQRFAQLVAQRTAGRVEVQVYPNSRLYKDGEEMDALLDGRIQMIAPATSKLSEWFPQWQLFDLPFLYSNEEEIHRLTDGPVGMSLMELLKSRNMLGLAMWDNGFKVMSGNRPLLEVEDFKGMRFRIMPSKVLAAQFQRLGAWTLALPFDQVYGALETGMVEGTENTPSNIYSKKFHEKQSHLTVSNHGYIGYAVITNREFWEGLPPDIRQILEDTMAEVTAWERDIADQQNIADLEAIRQAGTTEVHELSPEQREAWKAAMLPVWDQFSDVIGAGLLEAVESVMKLQEPSAYSNE
ncbi:C4-dicarboxylate ABC transporter [Clostridiales bacterium PH28_bin88]|nr:C4-dicarboxylate ABC transporter [Clostridiales bacterium PH28_bin88]